MRNPNALRNNTTATNSDDSQGCDSADCTDSACQDTVCIAHCRAQTALEFCLMYMFLRVSVGRAESESAEPIRAVSTLQIGRLDCKTFSTGFHSTYRYSLIGRLTKGWNI